MRARIWPLEKAGSREQGAGSRESPFDLELTAEGRSGERGAGSGESSFDLELTAEGRSGEKENFGLRIADLEVRSGPRG
jgi:hypothetical protein